VHAFVRAAFARGVRVIFGNHPTFQPLILGAARRRKRKDLVRLYASRYFVNDAEIAQLAQSADVVATDAEVGDLSRSLTMMRQAMLSDAQACALIAIGGIAGRVDPPPGIDEEIKLARARGVSVYLVGAVGGRSAELALEAHNAGWTPALNALSIGQNERLRMSLDFDGLRRWSWIR
jgi:hypothetical protein